MLPEEFSGQIAPIVDHTSPKFSLTGRSMLSKLPVVSDQVFHFE